MRRYLWSSACAIAIASAAHAKGPIAPPAPQPTLGAAAADTGKQTGAAPVATDSRSTPGASVADNSVAEVIVTAQHRSENVQKAALAITAINGGALARQGITTAQGLSTLVPSLTVGTDGPYTQVFLRGVGDFGGTPLSESPVAINLDQIYQASPALVSSYFYDVDRVELLKGPQGTLYGRNASGGALNILTNRPVLDRFSGYVTAGYGNYSAYDVEGALNLPVSDVFAVRVAGQELNHDGYYKDGYDDDDRQGGRVEALYRPNSAFSALLTADYEHQGGKGAGASVTTGRGSPGNPWIGESSPSSNAVIAASPGLGPFLRPVGDDGFSHVKTWGVTGDIEWDLGPATLSVIPAYRHSDVNILGYTAGFYDRVASPQHQFSIESRLGSTGDGPLNYTVGAYYFKQDASGLYAVDFGPIVEQITIPIKDSSDLSAAAFAQAVYSVTPSLRLTGGVRYTYEYKTLDSTLIANPTFSQTTFSFLPCGEGQATVEPPQGLGLLPGSTFDCQSPANGTQKVSRVNWKAGIEYDVAPHSLLFFTASTGFKDGGFYQGAAPNTFGPEELLAYEFGSKNRFLGNRLQVNVEGFLWKYTNQQVSHVGVVNPSPVLGYLVQNAGRATLDGVDVDSQYRVTPHDTIGLVVEYLHTNYDSYQYQSLSFVSNSGTTGCGVTPVSAFDPVDVTVNCTGKPLARSPSWSGTASYEHVFDLPNTGSLTFAGRTRFSSGYYTSVDYVSGAGRQSSFTDTSFDLTYTAPGHTWLLTAYVKNIEDNAISSGAFEQGFVAGAFYNSLMPPRTYGARATVNF